MTTTVQHTNQIPSERGPRASVKLTSGATWTNMPAAKTEFNGATDQRVAMSLRPFNFARLSANVGATAGNTAANLRVEYSLDGGSTWAYLDGTSGPSALVDATNSTVVGSWVAIASAAKYTVILRLVGITGDGVIDPVLGAAYLELSA